MSFEELIQRVNYESDFEKIEQILNGIVHSRADPYYLALFLTPFLYHVNNQNLNMFHASLQNPETYCYTFPAMIHNIVVDSQTNDRLFQVILAIIKKYS